MLRLHLPLFISLCLLNAVAFAHGNLADVVAEGNREHALEMIAEGTDVNAAQSDGTSALLYAVYLGGQELVSALVNAGADVNHRNEYGASIMSEAIPPYWKSCLNRVPILTRVTWKAKHR